MKLTKKKRLEKAKVKLKAKKLPKGQNVTDTSFKVRKIVLPNQLKDPKPGDITTKKLRNVKELISHLDHHKPQMRLLGLTGLKEIVLSHHPTELALDLPRIFDGITSLILDLHSNIRSYALDILKELLSKIPDGMLDPYFPSMKVYMVAAMTHINPFVQRDSLRMLDLMLSKAPVLMKNSANTFLPTVLDLVSKAKNDDHSERTLFDVFNKKVTAGQWREMVISRLTKYFSVLISAQPNDGKDSIHEVTAELKSKTTAVIHWNGDTPLYVGEHLSFIQKICYLSKIFESCSPMVDKNLHDEEVLKKHIDSVMPILFDTWTEVAPKTKNPKGVIQGDQVITLQFILETIVSLWRCMEDMQDVTGKYFCLTKWFKSTYGKKIFGKFISGFPYSNDGLNHCTDSMQRFEEHHMLVPFSSICVELNLLICYLVECLDCVSDTDIADRVPSCLNQCLNNWRSNKSLPTLKKVLQSILTSENQKWPKEKIVEIIIENLKIKSLKEEIELVLLDFVCDYINVYGSPGSGKALDKWLSQLPLLLLQPVISIKIVLALRRLSSQNRELFLKNLMKNHKSIVANLFLMKFTGASQVEGQKAVIEILFYARDAHIFQILRRVAMEAEGGSEEIVHFINTMEEFHLYMAESFALGEK